MIISHKPAKSKLSKMNKGSHCCDPLLSRPDEISPGAVS
jgi:hypothetical protein